MHEESSNNQHITYEVNNISKFKGEMFIFIFSESKRDWPEAGKYWEIPGLTHSKSRKLYNWFWGWVGTYWEETWTPEEQIDELERLIFVLFTYFYIDFHENGFLRF